MFEAILFLPTEVAVGFFFILGAILGSFANVLILRVPAGQNVALPGSQCFSCKKPVLWYDNLPLISWLLLRGRCRHCGASFSFRYWFVEALTAVMFALVFYKFGWSWFLPEMLIFVFGLIVVTFIDFDHFLLPDVFTLPGIVIGLVGAVLIPERSVVDSVLGLLFGGGFLWALAYFYYLVRKEEGLGGGDIKLLAWIGAVLGWKAVPFVIMSSSVLGSLVGLAMATRSKQGMKTMIPFGPYLAFGAVLYIFAGAKIAEMYMSWLFPSL